MISQKQGAVMTIKAVMIVVTQKKRLFLFFQLFPG